jgi:arylsulfatase
MKKMGLIDENAKLSPSRSPNWDTISPQNKKELEFRREIYAAQVDRLDQNIGRIVDYLKKNNQYENTMIIFLSDNGCSAESGDYGLNFKKNTVANYKDWKKEGGWSVSQGEVWATLSNAPFKLWKRYTHQGGIATPFIVHWPAKIKSPSINTTQVGHIMDIMPTLCEAASAKYPTQFKGNTILPGEGMSLVNSMMGQNTPNRTIFWEHIGNAAVRAGDYKLVKTAKDKKWELYNLKTDPTETQDLALKMPDKVKKLNEEYIAWAKKMKVIQVGNKAVLN